ncbi:hypothetical protein K438DRAFT_1771467 [Mycena galopus ATCC 62051]|nr:hypothetical protein K438DRAFT_1771467 [Mycena galopus ATCC 62051]
MAHFELQVRSFNLKDHLGVQSCHSTHICGPVRSPARVAPKAKIIGQWFGEIRNEVTWKKIGRDYKLVKTESAAADTACIEEATKATKEKNTNNEKSDNETELQIDTTSLLVPASVTFGALLSPDGFWLAPDGNWKKPTDIAATFADVKLHWLAIVPFDIGIFGADFPTC